LKKRQRARQKAVVEHSKFRIPGFPLVAETSVARFPPGEKNPLGLKYRLQLYYEDTGETLVRYDIHYGKKHHRHFCGHEDEYEWHGVETLFEDFRGDIEQIQTMIREEKL
jgi:hypothetical protein